MEFLMTYGWAILVVLVAIGALAYFGVLNPSRFLPSSCTIAPGIGCDDFKVDGTAGTVQLLLRNGMGNDLTGVTVDVTEGTCAQATPGAWDDGTVLGGATGITLSCTGISGSQFKGDVIVTYTGSSGIDHTVTGSLTTRVE